MSEQLEKELYLEKRVVFDSTQFWSNVVWSIIIVGYWECVLQFTSSSLSLVSWFVDDYVT